MIRIETPLLVLGRGPAALVAAKLAGSWGQPCLLVGHEVLGGDAPEALDPTAVALLDEHGLLDVLRPHLHGSDPPTIAPRELEEVLKQHCVADLNVGVYDRMGLVERTVTGAALRGVLASGTSRWEVVADGWIDAEALPTSLSAAIAAGAAAASDAIAARQR
jgi:hypothetical protein